VFAVVPRLTAALGWGLLTTGLVIGQFGALFGLPEWAQNLSPFAHTSAMPVEELDVASASILASIALLGVGVSALLFRRRDLAP
jgi:ABC-2 type transport system permease protein